MKSPSVNQNKETSGKAAASQMKSAAPAFSFTDKRPENTAQLKRQSLLNNTTGVVQAKLEPGTSFTKKTPPSSQDNYVPGGTRPLTGSPVQANIYVTRTLSGKFDPADLLGMDEWKDAGLLADPSKSNAQTLTRMHAVRGKFGGPTNANNMFLGTALSNNFNSDSHYKQVEQPIDAFLGTTGALGVDYTVRPNYDNLPQYIVDRANGLTDASQKKRFLAWANNGLPADFDCYATFYRDTGSGAEASPQKSQRIDAEIGGSVGKVLAVAGTGALLGAGAVAVGGAATASLLTGAGVVAAGTAAVAAAPFVAAGAGVAALGLGAAAALKYGGYFLRSRKPKSS